MFLFPYRFLVKRFAHFNIYACFYSFWAMYQIRINIFFIWGYYHVYENLSCLLFTFSWLRWSLDVCVRFLLQHVSSRKLSIVMKFSRVRQISSTTCTLLNPLVSYPLWGSLDVCVMILLQHYSSESSRKLFIVMKVSRWRNIPFTSCTLLDPLVRYPLWWSLVAGVTFLLQHILFYILS